MWTAVFTATIRPGIDVSVESIRRQTVRPDVWLVSDHLKDQRKRLWENVSNDLAIPVVVFNARDLTDRPYTIQAAYNEALRRMRAWTDLLVTMEDYIWLPPDAISRFKQAAVIFPDRLLGGIVSGSADPHPETVVDPAGLYTIFRRPYAGEPHVTLWEDCRLDRGQEGYQQVEAQRWEPPFAAIPRKLLDDDRLWFNDEYDRGMTHGNQYFAALAESLGYPTVLDLENRAWALPHHLYWPDERADHLANANNHEFHEQQKAAHGWA